MMNKWGNYLNTDGSSMARYTPNLDFLNPSTSMDSGGGFNMDFLKQTPNFGGSDSGMNLGGSKGSWWDSLFDKTENGVKTQGLAMPLIAGGSALMSGIMGYKQYGLQKEALKQTKKEFDLNWGAQQKTVNSQLEDRQRARVAANPSAYQGVGEYMKKNGI